MKKQKFSENRFKTIVPASKQNHMFESNVILKT